MTVPLSPYKPQHNISENTISTEEGKTQFSKFVVSCTQFLMSDCTGTKTKCTQITLNVTSHRTKYQLCTVRSIRLINSKNM